MYQRIIFCTLHAFPLFVSTQKKKRNVRRTELSGDVFVIVQMVFGHFDEI